MKISLAILGDVHAGSAGCRLASSPRWNVSEVLLSRLNSAAACIANLEGVLGFHNKPICKTGYPSQGDVTLAEQLKGWNISLVTLANNHAFDYSREGVASTLRALDMNGIRYVGAGLTEQEAWRHETLTCGEYKIGVLGITHNEFGVARGVNSGVASFNELMALKSIRNAKVANDKVVVLYHGGIEYVRIPSPDLRRRCIFFLEAGADAVICQHSHIAAASEVIDGKPIVYGQGDFIANTSHSSIARAACPSVVVELVPHSEGHGFEMKLHPIRISASESEFSVDFLEGSEKKAAVQELEQLNEIMEDDERWMQEWDSIVDRLGPGIESQVAQSSQIRRRASWRIPALRKKIGRAHQIPLLNIIRCEAHSEIIVAHLEKLTQEDK